jgi:hypothetical protein
MDLRILPIPNGMQVEFLTSAEIAPLTVSRTVTNLNSYSSFNKRSLPKIGIFTSVKEVLIPLEEGFAMLFTSTRTCPAGNSLPKKSFVSLAKSLNLAKQSLI